MARALGITEDSVSRLERRSDLLLSTLRNTVQAMGGQLVSPLNSPTVRRWFCPASPKTIRSLSPQAEKMRTLMQLSLIEQR